MTMHNRMHLGGGGKRVCYGNIILSQLILSSPVHPNLAIPQPLHHHNRHRRHYHHHHHHITTNLIILGTGNAISGSTETF